MTDDKCKGLNEQIALAMGHLRYDFTELRTLLAERNIPDGNILGPVWYGPEGQAAGCPPNYVADVNAANALLQWLRLERYVAIDSTRKGWQAKIISSGDELGVVRIAETWMEALAVAAGKVIEGMPTSA